MVNPVKVENLKALAGYQTSLRSRPKLRFLFFELTDKCNLRCRHCGSSCTDRNTHFLDMEAMKKVLVSVADTYKSKDIMVCLTGGEPLLYPGLFEVIETARRLGFLYGMTTNGTLIDRYSAGKLAGAGLQTVAVSVDGMREVHDRFRSEKGSFDRALFGIEALKHAGIEPQILTVVHRDNLWQLEEMFGLFRKMDIYSWRLVNVDPIGRAAFNRSMLLTGQQLKELFEFIRCKRFDPDNRMDVTYGCSHFVTYEYENELRDYYFQCGAGTFVAGIRADGTITGCLDIERRDELIQGNIYTDDFVDVWEHRYQAFRRNRAEESRTCGTCRYRAVCMGDSAHTWDYDSNEPGYCVAKMLEGLHGNTI